MTDGQISNSAIQHIPELLTALASILVAYLAIRGISHQVQSNLEIETFRRQSQLEAARASLPLALSQLSDICRRAIYFTYQTDRQADGAVKTTKEFALPETVLTSLKECISFADPKVASRLANLIRHFQVARSRTISSFEQPKVLKSDYTDMLDWATVQLLIDDCFDFARGISDEIPKAITKGSFPSVLMNIDLNDYYTNSKLQEAVKRRSKRNNIEFEWKVHSL